MSQISQSPTKRSGRALNRLRSSEYESRGLNEGNVEGLQVKAVQMELQRERAMNESLQRDIKMLREQLKQAEEMRVQQEKAIEDTEEKMAKQQVRFTRQLNE